MSGRFDGFVSSAGGPVNGRMTNVIAERGTGSAPAAKRGKVSAITTTIAMARPNVTAPAIRNRSGCAAGNSAESDERKRPETPELHGLAMRRLELALTRQTLEHQLGVSPDVDVFGPRA